jgi:hypothetical protein
VKRDAEFFGDQEMDLVYIAKKLKEALQLEKVLTAAGIDYAVEADQYIGGFLFKRERTGAFFYVLPDILNEARNVMSSEGFTPYAG